MGAKAIIPSGDAAALKEAAGAQLAAAAAAAADHPVHQGPAMQ